MNLTTFNKIMKQDTPMLELTEWQMFLELCSIYLKRHKITNPIVVELGTQGKNQKKFWEQLFNAEYIGIDISNKRETLKSKLKGRLVNILFINGDHHYEAVKRDFETYAAFCSDIIAFHSTETFRYKKRVVARVWKFWDELKLGKIKASGQYRDYLSLSIHKRRLKGCQRGIGVIIKK